MKKRIMVGIFIALLVIAFSYADQDNLDIDINMTNYNPVINEISTNQSSYDPTENSTTIIKVNFNVSDENGVGDLNNSRCRCEWDNTAPWASLYYDGIDNVTNTTCLVTGINITMQTYTCTIPFKYWYLNDTWSIKVFVDDNNGGAYTTAETNFTYNVLIASFLDTTIVNFGTIETSDYLTNVSDENAPIVITNTGNQVLDEINVSGANLIDDETLAPDIAIAQFYVDEHNITNAQQMANNSQKILGVSVPIEDATPGNAYDNVTFWFNVPVVLESGTYSATWVLYENI